MKNNPHKSRTPAEDAARIAAADRRLREIAARDAEREQQDQPSDSQKPSIH
jgi:hypothetical protein